ncbi:MAG: signal peptidase I [Phycisphaera sp.]|nr:signal peptidase I [Phycisphaera sp.]
MLDATQTTAKRPDHADESLKETFESIVIAFILAFVFRAYVVEAFVIPTGSMAPTLLGEHLRVTCAECGYQFSVDPPGEGEARLPGALYKRGGTMVVPNPDMAVAVCPMCRYQNPIVHGTRVNSGDRILVLKYLYALTQPQRWDVVVFKNPEQPDVNYIKRLVGLPGEKLFIVEGNIYVSHDDGQTWSIARKTDEKANRRATAIQRAVWQPIYHSDYVPIDASVGRSRPWTVPWVPVDGQENLWQLDGRAGYTYTPTTAGDDHEPGTIQFDFSRFIDAPVLFHVYNQLKGKELDPVEDVRLSTYVEPLSDGLDFSLQTTTRLDDPTGKPWRLVARIDPTGRASLSQVPVLDAGSPKKIGPDAQVNPFKVDQTRHVELWYVDQEASLWVDGERVLRQRFDLDFERIRNRSLPANVPQVGITVSASARLHHVDLDRDLYYTQVLAGRQARGALVKANGRIFGEPVSIRPDQFFCLGDNSPASSDGRAWSEIDPWVEKHMADTDPSDPLAAQAGVVPRDLMMGKAFFVYWPAAWRLSPRQFAFIPNFADMRFIH